MTDVWYVYVLQNNKGVLYTGVAKHVQERLKKHNAGKGAKFTRGRGPWRLIGQGRALGNTRGEALVYEDYVKKLPKHDRLQWCRRNKPKENK